MLPFKLKSINNTVITVTNTATSLRDLINTAGSNDAEITALYNSIIMHPEDGDVRVMFDNEPTSAKGLKIAQGELYQDKNIDFDKYKLIRAGASDVSVSVTVGQYIR